MKLRSLVAVALLVPAAALAAPASGSKASAPAEGASIGGFIGYETDDVSGLALRFDAEIPFRALSPEVKMSWVGSFGYSHLTESAGFGAGDFTANVFKFVPAARFTLPLNPQFSVFGDLGLGLAYVSATIDFPGVPGLGIPPFSQTDSTVNLMMRIGAGAWFHVSPQFRVGAMLEFDPIFGDFGFSGAGSQSTFNILAGAMWRI